MALDTLTLHGEILAPVTNVPAVGTVTFKILEELRDNTDNVIYSPQTFVATLDANGEFSIVLPVTDDPDVTPLNWSYWVYVDTDIWVSGVFYIQLPTALGPVAEFADLIEISPTGFDCTPDGTACAPIGAIGALQAEIDALETDLDVVEVTVGALVGQVNVITPIVLDNQADIAALEANVVYKNPPLVAGNYVGNAVTPPPGSPNTVGWLSMATPIPFSAGDTNPDFLRVSAIDEFGNTVHTTVFNGNGEPRSRPSTRARVGFRAFESAEAVGYSTGQYVQWSSNPTVAANREPYLGGFGSAHATKPGWVEATRVVSALAGTSIGGTLNAALAPYDSLSAFIFRGLKTTPGSPAVGTWAVNDVVLDSLGVVYRCTVAGTPGTWVAAVPGTPIGVTYAGLMGNAALITDGAAGNGAPYPVTTTYSAADNRVWLDGSMANNGGVAIGAQTTLFVIDAAHRPTSWVQFPGRTSTNLAVRLTVKGATGAVCVDQSLAAGATLAVDGANFRKS